MRTITLHTGVAPNPLHVHGAEIGILGEGGDQKAGAVSLGTAEYWISRRIASWTGEAPLPFVVPEVIPVAALAPPERSISDIPSLVSETTKKLKQRF